MTVHPSALSFGHLLAISAPTASSQLLRVRVKGNGQKRSVSVSLGADILGRSFVRCSSLIGTRACLQNKRVDPRIMKSCPGQDEEDATSNEKRTRDFAVLSDSWGGTLWERVKRVIVFYGYRYILCIWKNLVYWDESVFGQWLRIFRMIFRNKQNQFLDIKLYSDKDLVHSVTNVKINFDVLGCDSLVWRVELYFCINRASVTFQMFY